MGFTNVSRGNGDVVEAMREIANEDRGARVRSAWRDAWALRIAIGSLAVAIASLAISLID